MQPGAPDMTPRKGETLEEFRARQRGGYAAADPEYRERRLARQWERRRHRYATDPVYREQLLKRQRERYETDPEYRQQHCPGWRGRPNSRPCTAKNWLMPRPAGGFA